MGREWESIVIGGGVAGLSAALVLARARRRVLVVDKGEQSNLSAHRVGGLLGHDEVSPAELIAKGRKQVEAHGSVEFFEGEATDARAEGEEFVISTGDGAEHRAKTLVLAMGLTYEPPEIPGIEGLWGRDVFHCPFCHGWEVRDRKVAVLAGETAEHQSALIRGCTDDVTTVEPDEIASLRVENGSLRALVRPDGTEIPCDALMVHAEMHDRSAIPEGLGLKRKETGFLETDDQAQTSLPGVFAAGDVAVAPQQVAVAVGSGHLAGSMVVRHLLL